MEVSGPHKESILRNKEVSLKNAPRKPRDVTRPTVMVKRLGFRGTPPVKYKIDFWNNPITASILVWNQVVLNQSQQLGYLNSKLMLSWDCPFKGKIWVFAARPGPARPDPITLFKVLHLRNHMSDRQAVFFDEYHLDVKVVWHGYHIASVPVMARGACQTWGTWATPKTLYLTNRTTARPIGLRLGIQLGTQQTIHVCGSFLGCFSTCARAHPTSISRERLNRFPLDLACSKRAVSYVASAHQWGCNCCTCARAHPWPDFYISGTAEPIALIFGM